ncbi:MAG: LptA/OstA family protein [Pseudomonadota bacterium]
MTLHRPLIACVLLAGLGFAAPASGQQVSALKSHNAEGPIDIDADRVEVQERANVAIFAGDVRAVQGDLRLNADQLRVYYDRGDETGNQLQILRLDAQGGVTLASPSETVVSQWGVYDVEKEVITLGGRVEMLRGDAQLTGDRLELNLRTGLTTLDGAEGAVPERVRGRFTVPKKDEQKPEDSAPTTISPGP